MEVRVESYFCDLANGQEIFYMTDGKTHTEATFGAQRLSFVMKAVTSALGIASAA
jgi:hypothetical protein